MGSPDNAFAVEATRILRVRGWLTKESLRRAPLWGANLRGAALQAADLQGAILVKAVLQGADLKGAKLQRAVLQEANLQGADLRAANLQGADLWEACLQRADLRLVDLSTVRYLETTALGDAKADSKTQWPEGFQVPDTVVMVED